MPVYAKIAPRDGLAAILDSDGSTEFVYDVNGVDVAERSSSASSWHDFETAIVQVKDSKEAVRILRQKSDMCMCLDMVLMLFDEDISHRTKQKLATELQELLADEAVKHYVQDILFAKPLPRSANHDAATKAVTGNAVTSAFMQQLIETQPQVQRVYDAWLNLDKESLLDSGNADRVFAYLSSNGVFRRLALDATNQAELKAIAGELLLAVGCNKSQRIDPRDLQAYFREVGKLLPQGSVNRPATRATSELSKTPTKPKYQSSSPRIHESDHGSYEAALKEIETIADLYAQGKDDSADRFLDQLIDRLGKYETGQNQIVKTLCNIAGKVALRGRRDIGFRCHERALNFPTGIDAKLYLDIGRGLSGLQRYSEAVNCFEEARKLDDGTRSDEILLAEIRAQMEIGNYNDAISELRELPNLKWREPELATLGKAFRRMGSLKEATSTYHELLALNGDSDIGFAGLAEVQKQLGRPHQAIAQYNLLLNRLAKSGEANPGSVRVYNLSLSHLLRMTRQDDASEALLRKLLDQSSADRDANLQLAKLFALRGEKQRAQEFFDRIHGASLSELGQLVFAKASSLYNANTTNIRRQIETLRKTVRPEEMGVLQCVDAYDLITNGEFKQVNIVFDATKFIDRPVLELAKVLGFHAQKRQITSCTYKSDHGLCRIAKRSDIALRSAIIAIESGDDSAALQFEAEALLRLVA